MGQRTFWFTAVLVGLAAGLAYAQPSVMIDDFTVGSFTLTDNTAGGDEERATQSGLSTAHVAGGVRHEQIDASGVPAHMYIQAGDLVMSIDSRSGAKYNLMYNANAGGAGHHPLLGLDLSAGETFDVEFSRVDRGCSVGIYVREGDLSTYFMRPLTYPAPVWPASR